MPLTFFADDADDEFKKRRNKIVLGGHRDVVLSSPVDTGRYRGNHILSIGRRSQTKTTATDRAGTKAIASGALSLVGAKPYTIVWLQNNLPYGPDLEKGTSKQAPEGVYGPAFRRLVARNA